jgi:predicted acyltransferase
MRIASIDILRALTMLLMIWVNDFWTLKDVPKWLTHASATEDYMGFSDIIFPLFLFIVGLSIPFAIKNRLDKGDSRNKITKHILIRSLSLLLIGLFMVNWETSYYGIIYGGNQFWGLLMVAAVCLIWMNWKKSPISKKWHIPLQMFGWIILLYLALIYKGGPNGEYGMRIQWWGILGLIGWAYAYNSLIFLYSKGNVWIMVGSWLLLNSLAVLSMTDFALKPAGFLENFSAIYTGTIPAFTAAGILTTLVVQKLSKRKEWVIFLILTSLGAINIFYGLGTRFIWGISKIQGTPSWLAICTGIGFLSFVILYYITKNNNNMSWAKIISPAGTATLTCYMIPYYVYSIRGITGIRFPEYLNVSFLGLFVSFLFALAVVIYTGRLEKKGYTLKL